MSLHRADEVPGTSQPLCWRLFLPESWANDPVRCQRAGTPPSTSTKASRSLPWVCSDQALGWRSPAGIVLADEAYGGGFEWRLALRERSLPYYVRVP